MRCAFYGFIYSWSKKISEETGINISIPCESYGSRRYTQSLYICLTFTFWTKTYKSNLILYSFVIILWLQFLHSMSFRGHCMSWVFCIGYVQHGNRVQLQGCHIWAWWLGASGPMSLICGPGCAEEQHWGYCFASYGKSFIYIGWGIF